MAKYTNFINGFNIQSSASIDKRIILTKAEMLAMGTTSSQYLVPDIYFCLCSDDGKLYLYNKNNTPSATTGKFVLVDEQVLNNTRFTTLETKVGDAEAGTGLAGDVKQLQIDVTEIQGDVTTLQTEVTQLKEEVEDPDSGLLKRIQQLEGRLTEAEERMTEIEERIAAIKLDNIPGSIDSGEVKQS